MNKNKVIFLGAGGYAKSALDSLDHAEYEFCGFIDKFKPIGSEHLGYPIVASDLESFVERDKYHYFISIGDNEHRLEKYQILMNYQCKLISIIDKSALISRFTRIGRSVYIGKMAIINGDSQIGDNCIINSKTLIEHGCKIANHCNISTNVTINGDVTIDELSFIGSSSVFNGQLHIGRNVTVGSGSVVIRSIQDNLVVAGVPARVIRNKNV
ncbi:acetyltransferase [Cricetibacter osteomyelitidis]|nr:acetyltransferase [Cricetibacter osteomyelitidis]